jgi:hypothetical protein
VLVSKLLFAGAGLPIATSKLFAVASATVFVAIATVTATAAVTTIAAVATAIAVTTVGVTDVVAVPAGRRSIAWLVHARPIRPGKQPYQPRF